MKLLALRMCDHESNMTFYDNGTVKYIELERIHHKKNFAYRNLWQWKYDFERIFNCSVDELDEISVVIDPDRYGIYEDHSFEPTQINYLLGATCPVWKVNHHYAHALSGWMFGETDYQFVLDGAGDNYRDSIGNPVINGETVSIFKDYQLVGKLTDNMRSDLQNHKVVEKFYSIGNFYHSMCMELEIEGGYLNSPGKLMSLQSYGNFEEKFAEKLNALDIFSSLDQMEAFFNFEMWVEYLGSRIAAEHRKIDWVHTVHACVAPQIINLFYKFASKEDKIYYSGGVAQNIIWNTEIRRHFPNIVIAPHCGDSGLSLGGIEFLRRKNNLPELKRDGYPYWQEDEAPETIPSEDEISYVAHLLAQGKIVGWYQGNGEVGPRALGNRSILMHPMLKDGKDTINSKVKFREGYRPFGASVLDEHRDECFNLEFDNPHMLYLSDVKVEAPAITHIDGTCRHQTVGDNNPLYKKLIEEFYKLTGIPFVLNTSLNVNGKPICGNEVEALSVFHGTLLDVLVIGNKIYEKDLD